MLFTKHQPSDKWHASDEIIDHWLQERQSLLGLFYRILKIRPFEDESTNDSLCQELLPEFCQILIDYVSAGHFEVFEKLAEANNEIQAPNNQADGTKPAEPVSLKALVHILRTTVPAIDFSNKYAQKNPPLDSLKEDLNDLGQQLAKRLDLEDQLIQAYLKLTANTNLENTLNSVKSTKSKTKRAMN